MMEDCDELTLAYISIDTLREKVRFLEDENAKLKLSVEKLLKSVYEPHGASPGWSGDDSDY